MPNSPPCCYAVSLSSAPSFRILRTDSCLLHTTRSTTQNAAVFLCFFYFLFVRPGGDNGGPVDVSGRARSLARVSVRLRVIDGSRLTRHSSTAAAAARRPQQTRDARLRRRRRLCARTKPRASHAKNTLSNKTNQHSQTDGQTERTDTHANTPPTRVTKTANNTRSQSQRQAGSRLATNSTHTHTQKNTAERVRQRGPIKRPPKNTTTIQQHRDENARV